MAGSGLGNFAYAIFISKLLEYYDEQGCEEEKNCEGWRSALRIEAGVSLVLVLSASCLIKRKSVGKTGGDNCEEVDLLTFRQAVQTRPLLTGEWKWSERLQQTTRSEATIMWSVRATRH